MPVALAHEGTAAAGLGISAFLFSFGSGGVRSAVNPFIGIPKVVPKKQECKDILTLKLLAADQYTETIPRIKIRKNGERVVADRELTISYIYNAYYWYV